MNVKQKGRFSVAMDLAEGAPDALLDVLRGVLVIQAEIRLDTHAGFGPRICYYAVSDHFRELAEGETVPEYSCQISTVNGKIDKTEWFEIGSAMVKTTMHHFDTTPTLRSIH